MKRKYQLIIIVFISILLTYLIYVLNYDKKINIVAFGDAVASGETAFEIDGISYNDYLKNYFESKEILNNFSTNFVYKGNKLNVLIQNIKSNKIADNNKPIKQLINKADIITIAIGEEELIKSTMANDLSTNNIKYMLKEFDEFLSVLRDTGDGKIFVLSFYENKYLSKSNTIILNSELENIVLRYNAIFINIDDIIDEKEFLTMNNYYFNYKIHEIIAKKIIENL